MQWRAIIHFWDGEWFAQGKVEAHDNTVIN